MGTKRLLLGLATLALAGAGPAAAQADATSGPCLDTATSPVCQLWSGRVTAMADGDTIRVDIAGDGTARPSTIRVIDLQAMEQSVYSSRHAGLRRGECHALEATARAEQLLKGAGWKIRLSAQHASADSRSRLFRSIAIRVGGRWQDLGEQLIAEGQALWMPGIAERAWNLRYNRAEQTAAQQHVGLWDPTHCGYGPAQEVPLRVWASSDPLGSDVAHVNGEWIKIQNLSATTALSLGGWWVRDSFLRRFTFPAGTVAAPGATITVYVGHGQSGGDSFFWGLDAPIFENADGDGRDLGDGAYLFDPQGDMRQAMVYPCLVACSDPNQGALQITARPRQDEYVRVRNVSSHPVDLYGYELAIPGSTYPIGPGSVLAPGEAIQIDVQGDPADDTPSERHWGAGGLMLRDAGGSVRLTSFTGIVLACDAWGRVRC